MKLANTIIAVCIAILFSSNFVLGQGKLYNGIIIINQDSITGQIYVYDERDLNQIKFIDLNENIKSFNANQITGFINSDTHEEFRSFLLPWNEEYNISKAIIDTRRDHKDPKQKYLCKYLLKGKINLYFLDVKGLDPRLFAQKGDNEIIELQKIVRVSDGQKFTNDEYKTKLYTLLFDQPEKQKEVEKLPYSKKAIVKLINGYNQNAE